MAAVVVLAACLLGLPALRSTAAETERAYVTMSDGVRIAIHVAYPDGYAHDGSKWPTVFAMDGYRGAADAGYSDSFAKEYVQVYASARGTGCSGGKFDLLSWRTAQDGYEVIENWIVKQPWSNGKVGIVGHSYPGLTGFQVASLAPPHLTATAVSGIIDDFYRGIFYPGGVPNSGFPLIWEGIYRPAVDAQATAERVAAGDDPECAANIESRGHWNVLQHENIAEGYTQREATEGSWSISRGLTRFAHQVTAPMQMEQQFLDEQTGPRAANVLYEMLPRRTPKRLILSNGQHNDLTREDANKEWLDCWILKGGKRCGAVNNRAKRVVIHFETRKEEPRLNPAYYGKDWPLPETRWTRYFLRADGTLSTDPTGGEGDRSYVSAGTGRQMLAEPAGLALSDANAGAVTFADGPDTLRYDLDFAEPTAIAGPIALTLWAKSTAPDTDFYAEVIDLNEKTGEMSYLQRGILRASHRAIDLERSDRVPRGRAKGEVYRYWHPHVNPEPITPLEAYRYEIEIFPVAHYFRADHRLVLLVHTPPANDPVSLYAFAPEHAPAINTVLQGPAERSSVLLPVLPKRPPVTADEPACGSLAGIACFTPIG